jgi:uncharacterized membrane protein YraQ (UPF0718 family)
MSILYIVTGLLLTVSFIKDGQKTVKGLRIALKRFLKIGPAFLLMMLLVSVTLFLIPEELIFRFLSSGSIWLATAAGALIGSIVLMPGFIAYPLCAVLREYGVAYMVLSGFTTTLMMVGVLSFPIEKTIFGFRVALVRNIISLLIGLTVAVATGIYFGEVSL